MEIKAKRNGVYVVIIDIQCGNPKDAKEMCVIYANAETGAIGVDTGDSNVFDNFTLTEY